MKIILSRKGFDSSAGGSPSAIYKNKFYSIPIPEAGSGIFYKDLVFDESHSYLDVMRDLGIKFYSEAHLDPDLRKDILPNRDDIEQWLPLFGHHDKSQKLLHDEEVSIGDIFLFFGWFDEVDCIDKKFIYKHFPKKQKSTSHYLFGYFEIDNIIHLDDYSEKIPVWCSQHPHVKNSNFYRLHNTLYVAAKTSKLDSRKCGAGYFDAKNRSSLKLSANGMTKSNWHLPSVAFKKYFNKNKNNFKIDFTRSFDEDTDIILFTPNGRGNQEIFISDENDEEIVKWATDLISKHTIENDK